MLSTRSPVTVREGLATAMPQHTEQRRPRRMREKRAFFISKRFALISVPKIKLFMR
jgi:hypothetical protein